MSNIRFTLRALYSVRFKFFFFNLTSFILYIDSHSTYAIVFKYPSRADLDFHKTNSQNTKGKIMSDRLKMLTLNEGLSNDFKTNKR